MWQNGDNILMYHIKYQAIPTCINYISFYSDMYVQFAFISRQNRKCFTVTDFMVNKAFKFTSL